MGKQPKENDHDQQQQQNLDPENPQSSQSSSSRTTCSSALSRLFSLRCLIVIVLSFAILLSAIFWLFPRRSHSDDTVEVTASIQACFRLHKPASEVISQKGRLEHDIFQSIGLANTKVTVLSLNQSGSSNNWTDVEFAVLPNPTNYTINKHSLRSLRASFVKLFAHRSTLNLTSSSFGKPTSFQVLKFPGGVTIDPLGSKPVSRVLVILFDFILHMSLSEIQDCLGQLNDQLVDTLCLEPPHESIHILFTNKQGSTISPPVTVQVSVVSTSIMRNHLQQRLDHFAQIIQTSRTKNLGLNSSVFGEVKNVTYSTDLDRESIESASVLAPPLTSCLPSLC